MSVVCCRVYEDRIEIAADSISVRGWTQSKGDNVSMSKLAKVNGIIVGSSGRAEDAALMQLYCQTHQPKAPDLDSLLTFMSDFSSWKYKRTDSYSIDDNRYIVIYEGKAFAIEGYLIEEIVTYEAIGAGMDYALAAMYLGHDAFTAVEVASELSIYCEKPVVHYEVEK